MEVVTNAFIKSTDLIVIMIVALSVMLLLVGLSLYFENRSLKKHLQERNEILKEKFNITEDLI